MVNSQFNDILNILVGLKNNYKQMWNESNPSIPISERDIVSEIYIKLMKYCAKNEMWVHTELKPFGKGDRHSIDVGILINKNNKSWLQEAMKLQNDRKIARYKTVPVMFFHTAIEVKLRSNATRINDDVDKLYRIMDFNNQCNCFFVLLNGKGRLEDHKRIREYAKKKGITIVDWTANE